MSNETQTKQSASLPKEKISNFTYAKRSLYGLLFIWCGWLVSYSIEQYNLQDGENIFICDEEECFQTTHIHSDIRFDLCWASPVLPRETWPLDGLHTHKEKNYLHFHDRVEIDKDLFEQTWDKKWLPEKSLTVKEVIDVFSLEPEKFCDTDDVTITVLVDGQEVSEWLQHNWMDDEEIDLIYTRN